MPAPGRSAYHRQGASGEGIPAAADVFQLLRQGNAGGGAAVKGAPPGFGGGPAEGAVPPGMALLQRLQMGASAAGGQSGARYHLPHPRCHQ